MRNPVKATANSFVFALAMLLGGTAHAAPESIVDAKLNITLTLPDGFAPYPPGLAQPGTLYSYISGSPGTDNFQIVGIASMGGSIGREPIAPPQVPGATLEVKQEAWRSFEIEVIEGTLTQDNVAMFVMVAQVPIKPNAIQLKLVTPVAHKAEMQTTMRTLLASLNGPSNWLTDSQRSYQLGKSIGYVLCTLTIAAVVVVVRRRRKRATA